MHCVSSRSVPLRGRIAVVGTGISGLVAAWLLSRRHDVHVFEAEPRVGGHTYTVEVAVGGRRVAVDMGFIVHNRRNYPGFVRLLERLDIETADTAMSFSVACEETGLEWCGENLRTVFAQIRNLARPSFLRMLAELPRFHREVRASLARAQDARTLGEFLREGGFSQSLERHYVLPIAGAIWSADRAPMRRFPLRAFARFFENHGLLATRGHPLWRILPGGSRRYVDAVVQRLPRRPRVGTPVRAVRRLGDGVEIVTDAEGAERFDHAVIATHSDQALALLADPTPAEKDVLGGIPYAANEAVLHTDVRMLPRARRAWASWNAHLAKSGTGRVAVTYWMNRLQHLDVPEPLCVTLNRTAEIDPARMLHRVTFHHPVYDRGAFEAQARRAEICGVGRTHYCGAFWGYGFHEDGVQSALEVCERFGERL